MPAKFTVTIDPDTIFIKHDKVADFFLFDFVCPACERMVTIKDRQEYPARCACGYSYEISMKAVGKKETDTQQLSFEILDTSESAVSFTG